MHYDDARPYIEDGDTIAIRGTHGLLTPFTKFFTRSPYTHVGMAFWMDGMLWMFETNSGGDHAVPLSQFSNCDFDVFARPANVPIHRVKGAIFEELRDKTPYGLLGIPVIGLINYLRLKVSLKWRRILVCSGILIRVYERAGYPETTYMLSPAELVAKLRYKFSVNVGDAPLQLAA